MDFSVRHSMPGRVRLHVPLLCRKRSLAGTFLDWLGRQAGIITARINYDCASLVLEYDPAHEPMLRAMLERFQHASLNDIKLIASSSKPASAEANGDSTLPAVSKRFPLALPTVSLLMAFSANPLIAAVNLPLMLWNALPIPRRAWKVWDNERRLNIDVLDTLAISSSILQGVPMAGCIVTWLIKLGDWIRDLTAAGQRRAISELLEFQSKSAWVLRNGVVEAIPASALEEGDLVVVYPGEMISVDGEIVDGHATIDQKTITGEGLPVNRGVGETAFAATVIRDGQITVRALRVGSATTAGQIVHLVESAPIGDTRMQNHAEQFADRLVTPTLGLAAGTAAISGDFNRFLSLVIVDYGTGIRVAAPTSVLSSMTHAARAGIIIKSGGHMEKLAGIDTIVFDKTGTLTHGTPAVIDAKSFNKHFAPERLLALAVAAETRLKHPVAEALREQLRQLGLQAPPCEETEYRVGLGVEGIVDGHYMHVGSERFFRENDIRTGHIGSQRKLIGEQGWSCLYIALDGRLAGLVAYEDRIRPESREVIAPLRRMGIRQTIMLTGDNENVARAVANRLGLTRQVSNMLPADKAGVIQELQRAGG